MKLTLARFKHAKFASKETECFSAVVCIDGVPSIEASNEGTGGDHMLHEIVKGAIARLDAHAAGLPPCKAGWKGKNGEEVMLPYDTDLLISDLVSDELLRRRLTKGLRTKIHFVLKEAVGKNPAGLYTLSGAVSSDGIISARAYLERTYGSKAELLNAMPLERALALAKQVAR